MLPAGVPKPALGGDLGAVYEHLFRRKTKVLTAV